MAARLKKTCKRCIALKDVISGVLPERCSLGYKIEWWGNDPYGFTKVATPLEICPKPLTNSDYFAAKNGGNK